MYTNRIEWTEHDDELLIKTYWNWDIFINFRLFRTQVAGKGADSGIIAQTSLI